MPVPSSTLCVTLPDLSTVQVEQVGETLVFEGGGYQVYWNEGGNLWQIYILPADLVATGGNDPDVPAGEYTNNYFVADGACDLGSGSASDSSSGSDGDSVNFPGSSGDSSSSAGSSSDSQTPPPSSGSSGSSMSSSESFGSSKESGSVSESMSSSSM